MPKGDHTVPRQNNLTFSQAVEGLIRFKTAAGLSPNTLRNYRNSFAKLADFLGTDRPLAEIDRDTLLAFFEYLQKEYETEPAGIARRGKMRLSPKSILNIHTDLSALWAWAAAEGYAPANIVRTIQPPHAQAPVIETFTQADVELLLMACDRARAWKTAPHIRAARFMAVRDRAIILTLLDCGLRASELCGVCLEDLNMGASSLLVLGKGRKEREVFFGKRTGRALWKLATERVGEGAGEKDPLFVVGAGELTRPLSRSVLHHLLKRIGARAGVPNVYPHRFRHTFAINYMRNGGDLFTLQAMLGHSDLEMVRRYARIAQVDVAQAQQKASPVDNWRL
jgi:integrase/recombinase XerD